MAIQTGTSSFQISAVVPVGLSQSMYLSNQAKMDGFPIGLSDEVLSDDLGTLFLDDPTWVRISPAIDYEIAVQNSSPLCAGDTLLLQASAPEPGSYQWSGPQGYAQEYASSMVAEIGHGQAGRYYLQFTNYLGCSTDTFTDVVLYPDPMPTLGNDTSLCLATPKTLYAGDFFGYEWQDGSIGDHFLVEDYGAYSVLVADEFGCTKSDSIYISDGCLAQVYVPNAFTPNEDGANDELNAYAPQVARFQMQVFDRWGELVFKNSDITQGWDGTFLGKPMGPGVYAYLIEATFLNGQSIKEMGDVVLIR